MNKQIKKTNMLKDKITWTTKRVRLRDLVEWDKNPVKISKRDAQALSESLSKFDHVLPYVAAGPLNGKKGVPLLDGHQRKTAELQINKVSPDTMVDVRVPSRALTQKERSEIVIRLRKNTGEFDFEKLGSFFEPASLMEWGFQAFELTGDGRDDPNAEWTGMPEFSQEDLSAMKAIRVNFASQADIDAFSKLVKQKITLKTRSIWYPKAEKINMTDTYKNES